MVQHRDVPAALLALKSLLRFVPAGRLVVVADPSLTAADRAVFRRHFPGLELREAAEFRHPDLPQGGTWERLAAIAHYVQQHYVIQLDADTVALAPLAEVGAAVASAQPFTLGTRDDQAAESCGLVAAQARARLREGAHVQLLAESLLDRLEGAEDLRYVRGCSGFAGYPAGSFDLPRLCALSRRMAHLLGARWQQWGTEQFTSKFNVRKVIVITDYLPSRIAKGNEIPTAAASPLNDGSKDSSIDSSEVHKRGNRICFRTLSQEDIARTFVWKVHGPIVRRSIEPLRCLSRKWICRSHMSTFQAECVLEIEAISIAVPEHPSSLSATDTRQCLSILQVLKVG
ncbi:MAG: hypothetical protein EBX38_02200 [Actinobacteria bacterium]|nr:hypothetical protein [Actinomycetota bacterium]